MTHLKIEGMSCDHCVRAVREALTGVEGVESVQVVLGQAQVAGSADPSKLIAALQEEGFPAQVG